MATPLSPVESLKSLSITDTHSGGGKRIEYALYQGETQLEAIMSLVDAELSEPYIVYTYRYFLDEWYISHPSPPRVPPFFFFSCIIHEKELPVLTPAVLAIGLIFAFWSVPHHVSAKASL
jgi:hypothetical protein